MAMLLLHVILERARQQRPKLLQMRNKHSVQEAVVKYTNRRLGLGAALPLIADM
jgi:hypothetical protein